MSKIHDGFYPRIKVSQGPRRDAQVFRIPRIWYARRERTRNEILHRLGFVQMPGGGWACDEKTATRVVDTVCAYSFGWSESEREENEDALVRKTP